MNYESCPECGSSDLDYEDNIDIGEQIITCNECNHMLYYYCRADDRG